MTPTNPELRKFIVQFFSNEELETLCFDYFPEATNEFGGGMSKNRKVIILISHCEHRSRLADLHAAVARERPEEWNRQFTAADVQNPSFSEETRFPDERDPRQIFLSHATVDAGFAHTLAADLRAEGWKVWIAPDSIRPGEKWLEAINRGLETSGVFVVALTPAAVASQMVKDETYAAIDLNRLHEIRFTALDVIESRLPVLWRQLQYITFRSGYESGLDKLLRWLDGDEPSQPPKPKADPDRYIHEKTGIELIRIPAGPFLYGDDKREIYLPEYWIGRAPVTNAQYKRFLDANQEYRLPFVDYSWATHLHWDEKSRSYPADKADHPVLVSWEDAEAFCDWAGLALPAEEQWEKAARGTDGRVWPWGDDTPTNLFANFGGAESGTSSVGKYSPKGDSPYGCVDMTGNVWEWTTTWYLLGKTRVLRGGSWNNYGRSTHTTFRDYGPKWKAQVGFRVVELLSDPAS